MHRLLTTLCLSALLAPLPGTLAISCYQCNDLALGALSGLDDTISSLLPSSAASQPCSDVNFDEERGGSHTCEASSVIPSITPGCAKIAYKDQVIRFCSPAVPQDACQEQGDVSVCFCSGEFCNGAGGMLPALPLLLVVVVAVLAALK